MVNQVWLDVDAGYNESKNLFCVAIVILNSLGEVLGAKEV